MIGQPSFEICLVCVMFLEGNLGQCDAAPVRDVICHQICDDERLGLTDPGTVFFQSAL